MNLIDSEKITKSLINTFEEAGNISLKLRKQGLKTTIKSDNTPVTNGDIEVNNLLTNNKYLEYGNAAKKNSINFHWDEIIKKYKTIIN